MKINRQLHLVIEIDTDDGKRYVHADPLPEDVFNRYALPLAQVFETLYERGATLGAARIAKSQFVNTVLRDLPPIEGFVSEPEREKLEDKIKESLEKDFFSPLRGTAHLIASTKGLWETIQLDDAIKMGLLDGDDVSEVENALTFFTVLYRLHRKTERETELRRLSAMWGLRIEYLSCTEFRNSLPTSMQAENTGVKEIPLSIPA